MSLETAGVRLPDWSIAWDPQLICATEFRAMNTKVRLLTTDEGASGLLSAAREVFETIEQTFSRFLPNSELSRLNKASGSMVSVSSEMLDLLQMCRQFNRQTMGLFEPAILPHLKVAGYDRSFEELASDAADKANEEFPRRRSVSELVIDRNWKQVSTPVGLELDFGGIGKGYAVDLAGEVMAPLRNYLIDAGGDILGRGNGPFGEGWMVEIEDPFATGKTATVTLHDTAIATSSTARRRWRRGGRDQHHIIDPRIGAPADTDCIAVTVIADSAAWADVLAKCALILGSRAGTGFLGEQRVEGRFLLTDGRVVTTPEWRGGEA